MTAPVLDPLTGVQGGMVLSVTPLYDYVVLSGSLITGSVDVESKRREGFLGRAAGETSAYWIHRLLRRGYLF